jgi:uroporphyrinogen-III synthase
MRILVTRPAAQARAWVQELRERGVADAVALPLIGIGPPSDTVPLHAAWASLAQRSLVVFVSPNAVEQFFAQAPAGAALWPAATLAGSPGPGTTRELRAHGVPAEAIVEPAPDAPQFDSEALWAQLATRDWQGRQALIVRGDGGREWLLDVLRGAGAEVEVIAAYRRVCPKLDAGELATLDAALAAPADHVWLFSSSEAIDRLAALRPNVDASAWRGACAIATHPRIAERARALGIASVHATRPGLDAIVACIQSIRS